MSTHAPERRPARGARHTVLTVVGSLALLAAFASLVGGAALTGAHAAKRDANGFYATDAKILSTPTHALVSDDLAVGTDGPDWLFRNGRLGTIRVTATGTQAKPVFVGIAKKSQVEAYLRGVARDVVTDFDVDPFSVTYDRRSGVAAPAAPSTRGFWARSTTGSGKQTLSWPVRKGTWAVVVMNADATSGVRTDVGVGAKVPLVLWLGIGLLGAGAALAAIGGASIFFGTRRPPAAPASTTPVIATPVARGWAS
jgi:hypothetical protein